MFDIVSFGSSVVDIFLDTNISERKNLICYPIGSKILMKNLRVSLGGGGTNSAVAFSRLGFKTGYIGKIGDDNYGKNTLNMLEKENVHFLGKVKKNSLSDYSIILDSKENNRTILSYKKLNDELKFSEIKFKKIKTKWLYLSSLLGDSFESQKKLSNLLIKKNVKIAFNPSEYLIKRKNILDILKNCKILVLNKEEAVLLGKSNNSFILLKKLHKMILKKGIVVITNGNKKIFAYDGNKNYFLIPPKIKSVEKTGAGDAFASGFVSGQILEKTINESLKLGLKESQAVIRKFGSKNNLLKIKLK
jgi:ribokinase